MRGLDSQYQSIIQSDARGDSAGRLRLQKFHLHGLGYASDRYRPSLNFNRLTMVAISWTCLSVAINQLLYLSPLIARALAPS
jgi:hypothetical protein